MMRPSVGGGLTGAAALGLALVCTAGLTGQARRPYVGMLDEHPRIAYATHSTTDRIAALNRALAAGTRTLARDARTGYLAPVLDALGVPADSQMLIFSKTGVQRDYTSPQNPRALYFDDSVVVGYIAGAPLLEVAVHDPQQGVLFYSLDQAAPSAPSFKRDGNCITCHVSAMTLDVPGLITRSNIVDASGQVMPQLGYSTVTHRTEHTQRWGGWYVTSQGGAPPYTQMGNLGNITAAVNPASGLAIFSNAVFIEWLNSAPETRGYLSTSSDVAGLMAFDHQAHVVNLLTRLNWDARVAEDDGPVRPSAPAVRQDINELADNLLFIGEASLAAPVEAQPGFAAHLLARAPRDRKGRSLGELDLERRLLRYPCSYMIYTEAFDALPAVIKDAVYRRLFAILLGQDARPPYARLSTADRRAVLEILRDTKRDIPADLRARVGGPA